VPSTYWPESLSPLTAGWVGVADGGPITHPVAALASSAEPWALVAVTTTSTS
jgi:hypothetical protein